MAVRNITGFAATQQGSSGTTSLVLEVATSTTGAERDTTIKRTGGVASCKCEQAAGTGTPYATLQAHTNGGTASLNAANVYARFYFYYVTASAEEIYSSYNMSGVHKFSVRLNTNGKLQAYDQAGTSLGEGTTVLQSATWYRIEVYTGTGTSAAWEVRIDGATELSGTTADLTTSNNGSTRLGKGVNRVSGAVEYYFTDVCLDDATWPGPGQVWMMHPDGDGTYTAWTDGDGGGGNDYAKVDDSASQDGHDQATTYLLSTKTIGDCSSVTLESTSSASISGTIKAVKAYAVIRRHTGEAANGTVKVRMRSGTTDADSANTSALFTNWLAAALLRETDPATSAAWTTGGLDALEIGVVEGETTDSSECTELLLAVDHQPSGDVSVGLSSVTSALAIGLLSSLLTLGASSVSAAGSAGSVSASTGGPITIELTGVESATAVGEPENGITVGATGVEAVGSLHTREELPVVLDGVTTTTVLGALVPAFDLNVSGATSTTAVDDLVASSGAGATLTGVTTTGAVENVSPTHDLSVSGTTSTTAVGTVTTVADITVALTGVFSALAPDSFAPAHDSALTGVSGLGAVDTATGENHAGVGGVETSGAVGALSLSSVVDASGVASSTSVGIISAGADRTIPISGVTTSTAVGTVGVYSPDLTLNLTGVSATGVLDAPVAAHASALSGASTAASVGMAAAASEATLSAVGATGLAGDVVAASVITRSLTGVSSDLGIGNIVITGLVGRLPVTVGVGVFPDVTVGVGIFPAHTIGSDTYVTPDAGVDVFIAATIGVDVFPSPAIGTDVAPDATIGTDVFPNVPAALTDVR